MSEPVVAPLQGDSVEIDELVIRFGRRRRYHYLWIAVSRLTRQVLAHYIGDRSHKSFRQLWQRANQRDRRLE